MIPKEVAVEWERLLQTLKPEEWNNLRAQLAGVAPFLQGVVVEPYRNLEGIKMGRAFIGGACFNKVFLQKANFAYAEGWGASFRLASLHEASFEYAYLPRADFSGAIGPHARFSKAFLFGSLFVGAVLEGACFCGANLEYAVFEHAYLRDACFWGANLRGADLRGAYITPETAHPWLISWIIRNAAGAEDWASAGEEERALVSLSDALFECRRDDNWQSLVENFGEPRQLLQVFKDWPLLAKWVSELPGFRSPEEEQDTWEEQDD